MEILMAKVWVLDTETKGTGANVVPLEKVLTRPEPESPRRSNAPPRRSDHPQATGRSGRAQAPKSEGHGEKTSTPLPPGHVRKKATGEIGRVQSVDAKAGTARVRWLKRGSVSTVPLAAISRR
jgi:hypothetical protein